MPNDNEEERWLPAAAILAALSALFAYFLAFHAPATPIFFEGDHLIFLYDADRMIRGDVLYLDFFQFTFPGTQLLYYLLFLVFGLKYWLVGAVLIALAAAFAFVVTRISSRILSGIWVIVPAIVFIFFGFRFYGLDASHRMLSPLMIVTAILFLARRSTNLTAAAAGALCAGASFFTQQRGFLAVGAVGIFFLIEVLSQRSGTTTLLRRWASVSAGFIITLTVLLAGFIAQAGFETFYKATVEYPSLYYHFHEQNSYGVFLADLGKTLASPTTSIPAAAAALFYSFAMPLAPVAFFTYFAFTRNDREWNEWRLPVLLATVALVMLAGTTAPSQYRIFQVSAPAIIVLVWLAYQWTRSISRIGNSLAVAAIAALLILGVIQSVRVQASWDLTYVDLPVGRVAMLNGPVAERYRWLAANTSPGDHFFELAEPFLYFPLQLRNATGTAMIFMTELTRPEQIADVLHGLEKNRPKYILWENQYVKADSEREPGDRTAPLADYVIANYEPAADVYTVDGRETQIWRRKDAAK